VLVAIWMIVGVVLGLILYVNRKEALGTVGVAMGESEGDMAPVPSA
jgi:hypothetical protein